VELGRTYEKLRKILGYFVNQASELVQGRSVTITIKNSTNGATALSRAYFCGYIGRVNFLLTFLLWEKYLVECSLLHAVW